MSAAAELLEALEQALNERTLLGSSIAGSLSKKARRCFYELDDPARIVALHLSRLLQAIALENDERPIPVGETWSNLAALSKPLRDSARYLVSSENDPSLALARMSDLAKVDLALFPPE